MPQISNEEIITKIIKTTIGVLSRRTSEAYASVMIGNAINEMITEYDFLKYISVKPTQYNEDFNVIEIDNKINEVDSQILGKATYNFFKNLTRIMGKGAGFYFLKEIKESLPFTYEEKIKSYGVDFDLLQLEYLTERKETFAFNIENDDVMKYSFKGIFQVLDREIGRHEAYKKFNEIVKRISTQHPCLNYVKINDVSSIQNIEIVTIDKDVNQISGSEVASAIQKTIQQVNNNLKDKGGKSFIEKVKRAITFDYVVKLEKMGVNFDVIQLGQDLIVKNIISGLIDVLSEYTSISYAIAIVNNIIDDFSKKYNFLSTIKIDSTKYDENMDGINISDDINSVRPSELGRSFQKIIEKISISLGEEAGRFFVEKFKKRLGKAYVLKVEEIGVNLHMIELKRHLTF